MPHLDRQFALNAPPDAVWAQLATPGRWPAFVRHLERADWTGSEADASGTSVEIRASYRGLLRWSGVVGCRIDQASQEISVWQTTNPVVQASGRLSVRTGQGGQTIVWIQADYRPRMPLVGRLVADKLDGYLDKIADAIERAALTR